MSWRLIVPLAVIALGLAAYITFVEHHTLSSGQLQSRKETLLPTFMVQEVSRIQIAHRGKRIIFVRKHVNPAVHTAGQWRMVYPKQAALDKQAIDTLVSELEWMEPLRRLQALSKQDRTQFGLETPWIRLSYWVKGRRYILAIGRKDFRSQGYYAQGDDLSVAYVVNEEFVQHLKQDAAHYLPQAQPASDAGS